jgi:hypothetical protein
MEKKKEKPTVRAESKVRRHLRGRGKGQVLGRE